MKTKITLILCLLGLQVMWSQDGKTPTTPEKVETAAEIKKEKETAALKERAERLIAFNQAELDAVNKYIDENNKLLSDKTLTESASNELLATITGLIKQRTTLKAKISKQEEDLSKENFDDIIKAEEEVKKAENDAQKKEALNKKAAPFIKIYEAELESLNNHITELNKLVTDKAQSTDVANTALASVTDLIKQRNELKAKIDRLKTNPQDSDFEESTVKNKINVKEARYTLLNGVNFDFNDNKTNYVGHFNIYVPYYKSGDYENKWGINVGILKVNYMTRDSIVNFNEENVRINPLDNPDAEGESYNKQYNRYATSTKVISTSFYAQPMYRIGEKGAANFYLHGHFELLWSKFETDTKVKTIQNEQVTINSNNPPPPPADLLRTLETETHQTINLTSPHIGAGLTVDFNFKDDCILFLQPTVGVALNYVDRFPTQDADGNYTLQTYKKAQGFFLLRTYFQYNTSKATQIIIGTDIRGLLPDQQPYLSAYVGLNLGIDQIFKQ